MTKKRNDVRGDGHGVATVAGASDAKGPSTPIRRKVKKPPVPQRRLRVYALDPSIAKSLSSVQVNETTLTVPWDDCPETPDALQPGPVGEYLEVVDIDPATGRLYDPVDLNEKTLLAQDGWPPSEGNPQFHQQMVYAVGMTTIRHFEQALGRAALWAPKYVLKPGNETEGPYEVRRLRIYPHALRTANAYYSPDKKALLFGYFPAASKQGDSTAPGTMVFTCLSSDIIAHEMSHALLDGLHRRFQEASNPDVPAFHEAFADIVALFQHFTVPELVRFEISRARNDLSAAKLLGGLARQFGEGSSHRGPLRNYTDKGMEKLRYEDTHTPHERGSILVYAIYDAFLKVVARRTEGLVRLATGGTGKLPDGALHPELVDQLTAETCRAAKYVLHMCIRALDYCPPVDLTFGEYLRALITADRDFVPRDEHGHRVAFMEAFRERGILPSEIRTVSEETLSWNAPVDDSPSWLHEALKSVDKDWNRVLTRSEIFRLNEENRRSFGHALRQLLPDHPDIFAQLGLIKDLPRYNRDGTVRSHPEQGKTTFDVYSIRPARRIAPDGSFRTEMVVVIQQRRPALLAEEAKPEQDPCYEYSSQQLEKGFFWVRGGATLILDPRRGAESIRYSIIKNTDSTKRESRQRQTASGMYLSPLRSLYFGGDRRSPEGLAVEPFALMHAHDGD